MVLVILLILILNLRRIAHILLQDLVRVRPRLRQKLRLISRALLMIHNSTLVFIDAPH